MAEQNRTRQGEYLAGSRWRKPEPPDRTVDVVIGREVLDNALLPAHVLLSVSAMQSGAEFRPTPTAPHIRYASRPVNPENHTSQIFARRGAAFMIKHFYESGILNPQTGESQVELYPYRGVNVLKMSVAPSRQKDAHGDLSIGVVLQSPTPAIIAERGAIRRALDFGNLSNFLTIPLGTLCCTDHETGRELAQAVMSALPEMVPLSAITSISTQPNAAYLTLLQEQID